MKPRSSEFTALVCGFALILLMSACTDDRTPPAAPEQPSYNETKVLLNRAASNGSEITATFTVRDVIESGNLVLYCFLQPDAAIDLMASLNDDVDRYNEIADSISARMFELWGQGNLTPADSMQMENIIAEYRGEIRLVTLRLDSIDTWVDDRFKVSIWLDNDDTPLYPLSVMLDANTQLNDTTTLDYLSDSTIVWGQGVYVAEPGQDGWRGKRITLNLNDFWVADPTWQHTIKPGREVFLVTPSSYPERYTRYELLPVRDWATRITPGSSHTLHIRFGAPGTATQVTASLYLIYRTSL